MKRMMKLLLIVLVMMLALTGCGSDEWDEDYDDDAIEEMDDDEDDADKDADERKTGELSLGELFGDKDEVMAEAVTEEAEDEEDGADVAAPETLSDDELPTAYEFVLNSIYDSLLLDPMTDEIDNVHFTTGIWEAVTYGATAEERMQAIAYCIEDINQDGVKELIIVDANWPEPGCVSILSMYTLVEGTPVLIIDGWARNSFCLLDDGMIYYNGSGGAAYTSVQLYSFEAGTTELTSHDLYFTCPKDSYEDIGFYYNSDGIGGQEESVEISEEEFFAFTDDCESRTVVFDAKTFDLFK